MKAIQLEDGAIEGLKWAALILMTLDHVNKYVFHQEHIGLFNAGRVCVPLFALVLAYNLSREGALESGLYSKVLTRLAIFGAAAMPAFWLLGVPFFVLNIMFTLAVGVLCIWLIDEGGKLNRTIALFAFLFLSLFVEYWWFGVGVVIASWFFLKKPSFVRVALLSLTVLSLAVINGNFYALLALPIFYAAQYVKPCVPRLRYIFYAFYPAHLTSILFVNYLTH